MDWNTEELAEHCDILESNPLSAGSFVADLLGAAGVGLALGEPKRLVMELLRRAKDLGRASFDLAYGDGRVDVTIGDRVLSLPATGPTDYTEPPTWLEVFGLALATRDTDTVDALTGLDVAVMRESQTRVDAYRYDVVLTMQAFWRGAEWRRHAEQAVASSADARTGGANVVGVATSHLLLLDPLDRRDGEAFALALARALSAHSEYWGSRRWAGDLSGLLAIVPLGLAALAYDRGLSVGVESAYVPSWITRSDWSD